MRRSLVCHAIRYGYGFADVSVLLLSTIEIPIHDVNPNDDDIPAPIRCTAEKLADDGAYILENGIHMFVWVGLNLAPEFTQAVFSTHSAQLIDSDRPGLPVLDNPLSKRVRGIVDRIQAERPRCMRVSFKRIILTIEPLKFGIPNKIINSSLFSLCRLQLFGHAIN